MTPTFFFNFFISFFDSLVLISSTPAETKQLLPVVYIQQTYTVSQN